jgi:hypothetical protein
VIVRGSIMPVSLFSATFSCVSIAAWQYRQAGQQKAPYDNKVFHFRKISVKNRIPMNITLKTLYYCEKNCAIMKTSLKNTIFVSKEGIIFYVSRIINCN